MRRSAHIHAIIAIAAAIGGDGRRRGQFGCGFRPHLHRHHQPHHIHAHPLQQVAEHRKSFQLVFVERVALRIAAQPNHLAQMLQQRQMLAPMLVQQLQQQGFFQLVHQIRAEILAPRRISLIGFFGKPRAQFLLANAFFLRPIGDRPGLSKQGFQLGGEPRQLPLLGPAFGRNMRLQNLVHHLAAHIGNRLGDLLAFHNFPSLRKHNFALLIHHIIIFEDIFAHVKIVRFHLGLGAGERARNPGMDNRFALFQTKPFEHAVHAVGAENAHQIIFQTQEKAAAPWVALPPGAPAQLIVNAAAFVPLSANHAQAAGLNHPLFVGGNVCRRKRAPLGVAHVGIAAQLDVGAAPRHVGGNRNRI